MRQQITELQKSEIKHRQIEETLGESEENIETLFPVSISGSNIVIDGQVKGVIGQVRTIQSFFSYYNSDPDNICNKADIGGGGLNVPVPLEDAVANMQVINALVCSARSRSWVNIETGTTA